MSIEKVFDAFKFLVDAVDELRRVGQPARAGRMLQGSEQWNNGRHAARRAGSCATVRHAGDTGVIALFVSRAELRDLFRGLF